MAQVYVFNPFSGTFEQIYKPKIIQHIITETDIINKYTILPFTPMNPDSIIVTPKNGIPQINGIDYEIIGNELHWENKGLDGFLEDNDVLIVQH